MTLNEYQEQMRRTYKPERLVNHILGLVGEAGELADAYKKMLFHGRPGSSTDRIKELGDVLWYLAALATDEGVTLDEVAQLNVEKLQRRYPDGFVKGGGVRTDSGQ